MRSRRNYTKDASITRAQIRAARALLDWSREDLAERSGVSMRTLANIETDGRVPKERTTDAIRGALANAGIEFIPDNGGGCGVRFRNMDANASAQTMAKHRHE